MSDATDNRFYREPEARTSDPWCTGLPPFNKLVVAYMVGTKEHSDVNWMRDGFAFMVRHDSDEFTVTNKWSRSYYNEARQRLDADHLEVHRWILLERE